MFRFHIPDIHCDGCVRSLNAALRRLDSKAWLRADLDSKHVEIETVATDAAVEAAFQDAGFTVQSRL